MPTTQWNCRTETTAGELTVGDKFALLCEGDANLLKRESLSLRRPKDNLYSLKILGIEDLQDTSVKLTATTYVVGEEGTRFEGYALTDGESTIELAPFVLPTKSVITQENNPEGKPFGAIQPIDLPYPAWLWLGFLIVAIALVTLVVRAFVRARQRKTFLREIAARSTALAPYHQFQKELRQITRVLPVANQSEWNEVAAVTGLKSLEQSYYWFLAREFKIPAHQWSARVVHNEIRKIDRKLFKAAYKNLEVAERELRRAMRAPARLTLPDYQQLLEILRKAADTIHLHRSQESRR